MKENMTEKNEMDIYALEVVEEWVEDDELSAEEGGFMKGYLED